MSIFDCWVHILVHGLRTETQKDKGTEAQRHSETVKDDGDSVTQRHTKTFNKCRHESNYADMQTCRRAYIRAEA